MIELFRTPNYDFLRWKWHFIGLSWALILAGVVSLWMKGGPRYGIDFQGGTLVYLKFADAPDLNRIRAGLSEQGLGTSTIQRYGRPDNHEVIIGTEQVGHEEEALDASRQAILTSLRSTFQVPAGKLDLNNSGADSLTDALLRFDPLALAGQPGQAAGRYREIAERITGYRDNQRGGLLRSFQELRMLEGVPPVAANTLEQQAFLSPFVVRNIEVVGPRVGRQLRQQALLATGLALAGMLLYIGLRFPTEPMAEAGRAGLLTGLGRWFLRQVDKRLYGIAAVVATFHDVLITLGFLSLFNYEFNLNVVAGLLTLVGYSVNDTIVTFDRIRENVRLLRRERFRELVNRSVNQTLSRTVLTSGLTFLTVLALFFLGGEVLHGFAFTLTVGIVVGTYSTVFIASPVVVGWEERRGGRGAAGAARKGF